MMDHDLEGAIQPLQEPGPPREEAVEKGFRKVRSPLRKIRDVAVEGQAGAAALRDPRRVPPGMEGAGEIRAHRGGPAPEARSGVEIPFHRDQPGGRFGGRDSCDTGHKRRHDSLFSMDHSAPPPHQPARSRGPLPLSFSQERLWFLDRLHPEAAAYNVPALFYRLRGRLDEKALRRTLAGLVRRHEALRTTFPEIDGRPVQAIEPPRPFPLATLDLRARARAQRAGGGGRAARPRAPARARRWAGGRARGPRPGGRRRGR